MKNNVEIGYNPEIPVRTVPITWGSGRVMKNSLSVRYPQYYKNLFSEERTLWCAVIAQAIHDYHKDPSVNKAKKGILGWYKRQAAWWLFESQSSEIGSFLWICDQLKLNPDYVRKGAKENKLECLDYQESILN